MLLITLVDLVSGFIHRKNLSKNLRISEYVKIKRIHKYLGWTFIIIGKIKTLIIILILLDSADLSWIFIFVLISLYCVLYLTIYQIYKYKTIEDIKKVFIRPNLRLLSSTQELIVDLKECNFDSEKELQYFYDQNMFKRDDSINQFYLGIHSDIKWVIFES